MSGHPDVAGDSLAVNAFHDDAGNRESHHLLPPDWMDLVDGALTRPQWIDDHLGLLKLYQFGGYFDKPL